MNGTTTNNYLEMDKMDTGRFDLNDIQHEPTDEQLESLMNSVSQEAQRRAAVARQNLMQRLREEIATASRQGAAA